MTQQWEHTHTHTHTYTTISSSRITRMSSFFLYTKPRICTLQQNDTKHDLAVKFNAMPCGYEYMRGKILKGASRMRNSIENPIKMLLIHEWFNIWFCIKPIVNNKNDGKLFKISFRFVKLKYKPEIQKKTQFYKSFWRTS